MPAATDAWEKLYTVREIEGRLIVERLGAPFRRRYFWLAGLLVIVLALLVAYLFASRLNPWLWLLVVLVLLVILALAERAAGMRAASRDDRFVFDRAAGVITRNDSRIAAIKDVETVLYRDILDGDRPLNEYAVVLQYDDTKRTLITESHGMPGEEQALTEMAHAIANYVGVEVRREPRQAEQWWLDR